MGALRAALQHHSANSISNRIGSGTTRTAIRVKPVVATRNNFAKPLRCLSMGGKEALVARAH
eukprot:2373369-Lingulodinium_polyedra.AAC.1